MILSRFISYGSPDYAPTVRVGLDGTIQLPLIGSVQVEGLTVHQAQDLIAQKLVSAGMYRDPQVSIQMTESPNQIATVTGELHGIVPIIGERRLYDVLAAVAVAVADAASSYDGRGRRRRAADDGKPHHYDQPSRRSGAYHGRSGNRSCKERAWRIYRSFPGTRSLFRGWEWFICLERSRLRARYRFNRTRR